MSIYRPDERTGRPPAVRERDVWRCRKCRHGFRRLFAQRPIRWEVYATCGVVRRDLACAPCLRRLDALAPRELEAGAAEIGGRVRGVDA